MSETDLFHDAIASWWSAKKSAVVRKSQGGTRDESIKGNTMDGFAKAIQEFVTGLSVNPGHVFAGGHLASAPSILPSYFRPSKNWDVIIVGNSRFHPAPDDRPSDPVLYAAVEFKSQDKSIGNNQNNRMEESIGNATDFWTTYAESGFARQLPRPWLGYLFVGKYQPTEDGKPVKVKQPHFLAMQPFRGEGNDKQESFDGLSYADRYQTFIRHAIGARLYDAGAFIMTDEAIKSQKVNHRIPAPEFGPANFLRSLKGQILANYPGAKVIPGSMADSI
ncbi:MAG TPA: PaeR7I family type II restriction endonuclease [Opitutaceae bacterium]|nr:PaeR7I family type II restriction endonuclease [Opitutaceae bacterium]